MGLEGHHGRSTRPPAAYVGIILIYLALIAAVAMPLMKCARKRNEGGNEDTTTGQQ